LYFIVAKHINIQSVSLLDNKTTNHQIEFQDLLSRITECISCPWTWLQNSTYKKRGWDSL